ncbi:MAG: InlB B-repeat-containing protein, partial [Clostridia bacterium]|nr:InlB B-repeat-containing protein [Clostridia bacterium]
VVEGETYDETIIVPDEMPAQTGYHVIGYSMTRIAPEEVEELSDSIYFIDAATGNTTPELPDFTTATNRTWYYVWAIDTHTVTYNANTGAFEDDETIKTKELDYGSIIPAYDTDPVKYGYNFAGWNTEADGSGTYVTLYNQGSAVPTPVTGDIEVFAIYRKGAVTVNYYVTIDGTTKLYDSYNMNYGDTVEPIEYISDEYTVTWYTDQAMTAELPAAGFEITSTDTINIYGAISGKSYTATFTLGLGDGEGAEWPEGTTVNADNAVEKTFVYEENIVAPVPTWEGHRFLGYSPDVGTMPAADVTFEALWTENEYVIHYITDGTEYEVIPVYLNGELDTPEDPEKTGYTFAEWKYYTDSALQTAFTGTAMPARDLYADAVWDINTYEITYVAGEGAELGADTETPKAFDYNATITVPENNPTKPGYAFTGWRYTDADNNVYTGTTMPAYNLTATAKWGVLFTTYNYYITTDGGDRLVETASVPYGSTYVISSYSDDTVSVTQWIATVNGETVIYNTGDEITVGTTGNIVLTGVNDTAEYTATFTLGTGASAGAEWAEGTVTTDAGTVEQTYVAGAKINAPVPTWTGHQFVGYAPEAESMPAADTTYEAVWVTDELTVTYMVDGAEYEKSVVSVGDALSAELPEDPEKEGHEFVGWDYYDADDNEYSGALMPNYNLIAIAQFDVLKYTLTWAYTVPGETEETKVVYDGADGHKDQVYYGTVLEEVEKPVVDEVEGYVFTWDAFDETMPAEDYTIHGTFTIQQYTLTWTYTVPGADEATVKSDDIDYATAITGYKPDVTPVEGYEFNWYEDAEGTTEYDFETNGTMPAQALTVYGVFKIKSHNLIWSYVDPATNETVETAPESVEYGTELAPLAPEVTITGYDFTWNYNGVTTMPDDDLTIYGTTNKQSFTVTYVKGDGVWSDDDTENKEFTVIFEADEVPVPVEELSREYYTFGGWINEADENKAPTDYATMPAKNLTFTAVWNRIEVKLVPNGSSSTAMIERDGVVETYNEFGAGDATPYGVTSIIEPTATRTETEDFSRWFVYGLSEGLTEEQLRAAVTVQGDGEFTVAPITTGSIGTGAVITVTDRVTGKVVEQFYVVIFGDVDGDSVARSADTGEVRDEIADSTWAGEGLYCKVKAADLDGSGNITGNDVSRLKSAVRNVKEIDQITGLAK